MLKFNRWHQRLIHVTESNITELMASVDFILMGLGGVYWLGKDVFPGSSNVAEELKKMGQHIIYFTNNDMHTRAYIQNELTKIGIKDVKLNEICSVSHATAVYIKEHLKITDKVYCLGPPALHFELKNCGINVLSASCDSRDGKPFEKFLVENKVEAIVMGIDTNFSYHKARALSNYMLKHDVVYITTNMQPNYVRRNNRLMPGIKAQAKMIKELSGRKPDYVIGKPEEPMFRVLMSQIVIDLSRTLLIGHRLETDILFAYRAKVISLLVLSGMASLADARSAEFSDRLIERASCPDFFVENIQKLQQLLSMQDRQVLKVRKMTVRASLVSNVFDLDEKDEEAAGTAVAVRASDGAGDDVDDGDDIIFPITKTSTSLVVYKSKTLPTPKVAEEDRPAGGLVNAEDVQEGTAATDVSLPLAGYYKKNLKYTKYKALVDQNQ